MTIKDHVMGTSTFVWYKDGELWYKTDDTDFTFPVRVNDLGTATVNRTEKSLLLMRYIRQWLEIVTRKEN